MTAERSQSFTEISSQTDALPKMTPLSHRVPRDEQKWWFSSPSRAATNLIQAIISVPSVWTFRYFADLTILGKEHLRVVEDAKRKGKTVIFASNHQGDLDVLMMRGVLGFTRSPLTPLRAVSLQKKNYSWGFMKRLVYSETLFRILGAFPAFTGLHDYRLSLRTHERFLKLNETVCIFPEGRISNERDFHPEKIKGGLGYLALETKSIIVPVVVVGSWRVSLFDFLKGRHRLLVSFEQPIFPDEITQIAGEGDAAVRYRKISHETMHRVHRRFHVLRKEYPDAAQPIVERWDIRTFGGEYSPKAFVHQMLTLLVAYWCVVTNGIRIIIRMVMTGKYDVVSHVWYFGRNSRHYSTLFFDRLSHWNHDVKVTAASWRSLEPFYFYHIRTVREHHEAVSSAQEKGFLSALEERIAAKLSSFWMGMAHNRQALRNRLLITTELLVDAISKYPPHEEIHILSVASGSARAVIDAMLRFSDREFKVTLVDLDPSALDYARTLAQQHGLEKNFRYVNDGTSYLRSIGGSDRPHIVEMVGFLDYRPHGKAVGLSSQIKEILREKGTYVMANIQPNSERMFLEWVVLWPMIYRKSRDFLRILTDAGFSEDNIRLVQEPFRIHIIGAAQKD